MSVTVRYSYTPTERKPTAEVNRHFMIQHRHLLAQKENSGDSEVHGKVLNWQHDKRTKWQAVKHEEKQSSWAQDLYYAVPFPAPWEYACMCKLSLCASCIWPHCVPGSSLWWALRWRSVATTDLEQCLNHCYQRVIVKNNNTHSYQFNESTNLFTVHHNVKETETSLKRQNRGFNNIPSISAPQIHLYKEIRSYLWHTVQWS